MSLLITWRIRHVPASGANVRPVRRADWMLAATSTVNASTRRLGSEIDTWPQLTGSSIVSATTLSMPLKSAVESEVERDLVVAGAAQAVGHHGPHLFGRSLAYRSGDHARLTEAAPTGAPAEDLDVEPVVDDLGERHELVAGVGPLGEIGDGALLDDRRHIVESRLDRGEATVVGEAHVVHRGHVDARDLGQRPQHGFAAGLAGTLPAAHDLADLGDHLFAVAEHEEVDEVGQGLGVVGAVSPGADEQVIGATVGGPDRTASEIHTVQDVGVDELCGEVERQDVEVGRGTVGVDAEQRQSFGAHLGLEVGPWRIGALGDGVGALVDDLIEDLEALVGQPDLVGVGIAEQPGNLVGAVLGLLMPCLEADVAGRLLDTRQDRLELGPDVGHGAQATTPPPTIRATVPDRCGRRSRRALSARCGGASRR